MAALSPSSDPVVLPAYRFGQLLAVVVVVAFAFKYGVIVAGSGLVVALVVFRVLYGVMRGIVFPVIEALSQVIAGER